MSFRDRFRDYHIEIQHILVLFIVLVVFQTALSFINSQSTNRLFNQAMEYFRRDSAERVADLTAMTLEMQIDQVDARREAGIVNREKTILALDKFMSQQILQRNIDEFYIIVSRPGIAHPDKTLLLRGGEEIYELFFENHLPELDPGPLHQSAALAYYNQHAAQLRDEEQIISSVGADNHFDVLVPIYVRGEITGAVYMRITPDVADIVKLIESAYNQSGVLFTGLILMGFMAMFFIYSYTARERDVAQRQLFEQQTRQLREQVEHQKESLFTKRIYHTHHKAEKVMGFIKEDLRNLNSDNLEMTRDRVNQYANFVSRVIYDMKSYDPPLHVIRNPLFHSRINQVIEFIVKHIFQRVFRPDGKVHIQLELTRGIPDLQVNEYVIWEIIEPLIQNAIDHNADRDLHILIRSTLEGESGDIRLTIEDDGAGIAPELLERDAEGVRVLFRETISTKDPQQHENSGYGCYLAWEITKRCGWKLDAENLPQGGARFTILTHKG